MKNQQVTKELKHFIIFFSNLYKKQEISLEKIEKYLNKQNLPKLSQTQQAIINSPITNQEIIDDLKKLKIGKTPGPDGISAGYYKYFLEQIINPFRDLLNLIIEGSKIPRTWTEANITLIPKEEQDPTLTKNYRPILLLNNDYKKFTSILAERLKIILQEIIDQDQNGFLPKRQLKDNMRTMIDILE